MNPKHLPFVVAFFASLKILSQSVVSQTFAYTGAMQSFTIPTCALSLTVEVYGGSGGINSSFSPTPGTWGGMASAVMNGTPGVVLNLFVGGKGTDVGVGAYGFGGYNGGGDSPAVSTSPCTSSNHAAAGGGASDVRLNGVALTDRIIVAGGGGGMASAFRGGAGGGGRLCIGSCYIGVGGGTGLANNGVVPDHGGCAGDVYDLNTQGDDTPGRGAGLNSGGATGQGLFKGTAGSLGLGGRSNNAGYLSSGGGGGGYYGGGGAAEHVEFSPCGVCCRADFLGAGGGGSSYINTAIFSHPSFSGGVNPGNGSIIIKYSSSPNIVASHEVICGSGSSTLSLPGLSTYSWSTGSTNSTIVVSPTVTSTYNLTGSTTVTGCPVNSSITLSVSPTFSVGITSSSLQICKGQSATLTASGASSYTWMNVGGLTPSIAVHPTVTTEYVLIGSQNGCTAQKSFTLTVNPKPTVSVTVLSPSCTTGAYTLTSPGGSAYQWNMLSYSWNSSAQSPTVLNTGSTPLVATLNYTSTSGCVAGPVYFNVKPVSNSSITASGVLSCASGSSTATLSVTGAGSAATYTWYGPSNYTSSSPSPTLTNPVAGEYTVQVSDASGCKTFAWLDLSYVTLTNSTNISCVGQTYSLLVGVTSGGNPPLSYSWTGPGSFSSALANPTISPVSLTDAGTYTVTVTNAIGCSATRTINLNVFPSVSVTANGSGTVCLGKSATLTASGGTAYVWQGPQGVFFGNPYLQTPSISAVGLIHTGTYTVTATTTNGCKEKKQVYLTVVQNPTVSAVGATICSGSSPQLTSMGAGLISYQWNGPNSYTSTQQNPTISNFGLNNVGVYTVTGTDANGCSSMAQASVSQQSNMFLPIGGNHLCAGQNLSLTANPPSASTFTWTGPAGFSSNLQNPVINNVNSFSNTGTYSVAAMDSFGCVGTNSLYLVVMPVPPPFLSSYTVCEGDPFTLAGNSDCYTNAYSWSGPGGFTASVQHPSLSNVALANSGTYTLVTSTSSGCSFVKTIAQLSVNPSPTITATGGVTCIGNDLFLSANSAGASSYTWTGPGSFTSSTQNPTLSAVTPSMSGDYTVMVMDNSNGCIGKSIATVSVVANLSVTAAGGSVCAGQDFTLTCASNGASAYTWFGPSGFTSGLQNPVLNNPSAGVYTVTASNGSSLCSASTTINLGVFSPPSVSVANTNACVGSSVTLTAFTSSNVNYLWSGPSSYTSIQQNPILSNITPSNAGDYTLTVTDSITGCSSVVISSLAVLSLPSIVAGASNLCAGQNLSLTASGSNLVSFSWAGPGNFNSNLQNPVLVNSSTVSLGIYTITATDNNGCVNSTTVDVNLGALPLSVNGTKTICENGSFVLIANSPNPINTYSWTGANGYLGNSSALILMNVLPSQSGTYTLTVEDANNCKGTNIFSLTVNPSPQLTLTASSAICGVADTLVALGADTYSINSAATQFPLFITSTATAIYTVTGSYLSTGCSSSQTVSLGKLCVGINNLATKTGIVRAYPNPSEGILNVEVNSNMTVMVYDAVGKKVFEGDLIQGTNKLDLTHLLNGIYLLRFDRDSSALKFIKQSD